MLNPKQYPIHKTSFNRFNEGQLRTVLISLFLILAAPTLFLSVKAREQIKWEALYQQRQLAEELSSRIDENIQRWVLREQNRPTSDYSFLAQSSSQSLLQRSPLSNWPYSDAPAGLIGYFQLDDNGNFQTPLLPAASSWNVNTGFSPQDLESRTELQKTLYRILSENQLARVLPQEMAESADAAFDRLEEQNAASAQRQSLGKVGELKLERDFAEAERAPAVAEGIAVRKKEVAAPAPRAAAPTKSKPAPSITLFRNQPSPMTLALLESGHLILFRYAWQDEHRLIQGLILEQSAFLQGNIEQAFRLSSLNENSSLVVAFHGDVLTILQAQYQHQRKLDYRSLAAEDVTGTLLLQSSLSAPLGDVELIFSAISLPDGPGGVVLTWASVLLIALLILVFGILYRLGIRQIRLGQQQQNFIASVSHELKTPLTSIRMFSEMLKEGWAPPEKQQEYYQFISEESERLSRLISNVLQLARMEKQDLKLNIQPCPVHTLLDLLRSRIDSQLANSEFTLNVNSSHLPEDIQVLVDPDAVMQIVMNLVDNSLKFAANAAHKCIDLTLAVEGNRLIMRIRDYGPGIPDSETTQIFTLFYRIGNELTRSAQGTGIGLALVQQLVRAMNGGIELFHPEPGAGFKLNFPIARTTTQA